MPLQMVLASVLNASVWSAYGITIGDERMSVSHLLYCFVTYN
jgi:hypothetical protein